MNRENASASNDEFKHVLSRFESGKAHQLSDDYLFIRARHLEGSIDQGPEIGTWPITVARIAFGWGNVPDASYKPSEVDGWPPEEPKNHDVEAKKNRVKWYQRVRDVWACARLVGELLPPSCAFEIFPQWFQASNGFIESPSSNESPIGSHAVAFNGIEIDHQARMALNQPEAQAGEGLNID